MSLSETQKATALLVIQAMVETIEEAGPEGIPSGPLYAAMMPTGMQITQYQYIIAELIKAGKVRQSNHVLYWIKQPALKCTECAGRGKILGSWALKECPMCGGAGYKEATS